MSQRAPEALNSPIRVQRSRATPRNVACVTQGLSRVALGGVMHRSFLLLAIAATPVALPSPTAAQQDADTGYAKTQAMVPIRDGVKLHVVILAPRADRKSTRLNSSHSQISYAVFCLKKKNDARNDAKRPQACRSIGL